MSSRVCILSFLIFMGYLSACAQENIFSIEKTPFSTPEYDEFSPVIYDDGIVFCSNYKNNMLIFYTNLEKPLYNLFFTERIDSASWERNRLFSKELTTIFNDGPASITKNQNKIFFSRNIKLSRKLKDILDSTNRIGIFSADHSPEGWMNIQAFPYNSSSYSLITPSISADGTRIFFSSDMPGGYGGYDLYYSDFVDTTWQQPINMGETVNTPGDESYPFLSEDGKLFFASSGHPGFGEKDIFYTQQTGNNWISPINLGSEINSNKDDFGFITDKNFLQGYYSSNRDKSDDIYEFRRVLTEFDNCVEQKENKFCFLFYDDKVKISDTVSIRYEWNFSTGDKLIGERINYCFPKQGKYSVTLFVINSKTNDTINLPSPFEFELKNEEQAYISSNFNGNVNESLHFDGLETNLPNFEIAEYLWNFGDGFTKHGPVVKHSFDTEGEYLIKLGLVGKPDSSGFIPKVCVSKKITIHNLDTSNKAE